MAIKKYIGTGTIADGDFKAVKWIGMTKSGSAVTIELENAINLENIDMTFAEKSDVVPTITFTACYDNTDSASTSTEEPWSISIDDSLSGADSILLGSGMFYVGGTAIALTRGGGSFSVEREIRPINADGDRGTVVGRVVMEASTAKLTLNALTFLGRFADLYPAVDVSQ